MVQSDRVSSAAPFCSSLTESPTPVQLLPSDAVEESVDPVVCDGEVEAAVQKMLGLIDTMSSWPGFARTWLMTTSANKDGAREIAQTIVKDDGNHQGFKKYSPEKKARIVSLLMKGKAVGRRNFVHG